MIDDGRTAVIDIAYLIAAVFFIFGLKFLSSPKSARRGNQLAALGMAIAVWLHSSVGDGKAATIS